jgi:hypothetical protein
MCWRRHGETVRHADRCAPSLGGLAPASEKLMLDPGTLAPDFQVWAGITDFAPTFCSAGDRFGQRVTPVPEVGMSAEPMAFLPDPRSLVDTWRRFGPFGPVYRIVAIAGVLENGDTLFQVAVPGPRGDELTERRYSEVLADPEEG